MRTISAAEASRRFSELLDAIEAGDTVTVTRNDRPVAEIRPARRWTGSDLRAALAETTPPDEHFAEQIAEAVGKLKHDETDPWVDV